MASSSSSSRQRLKTVPLFLLLVLMAPRDVQSQGFLSKWNRAPVNKVKHHSSSSSFCSSWWKNNKLLHGNRSSSTTTSSRSKHVSSSTYHWSVRKLLHALISGGVSPAARVYQHILYWLTALNTVRNVILNEYTTPLHDQQQHPSHHHAISAIVPAMYSKLFYFARLRPRLLYAVGALLRALQLCTPFGRILDPTIGVGAGINLCALLAGSRWVKPVILGWATTRCFWVWLGAKQTERAHIPITVSLQQWERYKKQEGDTSID